MEKSKIGYIIVGVIILALLAYYSAISAKPSKAIVPSIPGYTVYAALTDPPHVPNGTQVLNMSYADVRFHVVGANYSEWITSASSGEVNLLGLVNISRLLGSVNVPHNALVNELAFNVTGLSIVVNGTSYPVAVPNSTLTLHIAKGVNATSTVLADLSPTVVTIITNNSTPVFVMVPSVRAVIVPGVSSNLKSTGYEAVNATEHEMLELARPNISITGASLSTVGNVTRISISVSNNANESVVLRNVLIFGNETATIYFNLSRGGFIMPMQERQPLPMGVNVSKFGNSIMPVMPNISQNLTPSLGNFGHVVPKMFNGNIEFNSTSFGDLADYLEEHHGPLNATEFQAIFGNVLGNASLRIPAFAHMNESQLEEIRNMALINRKIMLEHTHFRVVNFLVGKNGTLILPFSQLEAVSDYYEGGYVLAPHTTATLTFDGKMTIGNSNIVLKFESGSTYRVIVIGEEGARAFTNVTAG